MNKELVSLTALELAASIREKKFSIVEVVNTYINQIDNNNQLNTFITVARESALERAKEIQSRIDSGENLSPLAGVPVALEDNISANGIKTTCASKMLGDYIPVFNASVVDKLEQAGLIVIGKLNMNEFGLGGCDDAGFSGEAGAKAITAGQVPLALGSHSDTWQSFSSCGITRLKPTYGSVSRYGIISSASSLDQVSPAGQDIEDCSALLSIISGPDDKDSTCIIKEPFEFNSTGKSKNIRIGFPVNCFSGVDEEIKTAVFAAAKEIETAGASSLEEFEMPLMDYALPVYEIIEAAEAGSNLAKYDGLKFGYRSDNAKTLPDIYRLSRSEGFGYEVKRKIMLGSFVLSAGQYNIYYKKALQVRSMIKDSYKKLFEYFDIIVSPVTSDITASVSLTGLPAVYLPCGFDKKGLPIGLQLIGSAFSENLLINTARIYQTRTNFHKINT